SGNTHYNYYPNGTLQSKSDAIREIDYSYDRNNRLKRIATPDGVDDVDFTYDDFDNRKSVSNTTVQSTFDYDATRLTGRTDKILGSTFHTTFEYDGRNNLTHITYPSGRNVYYSYDNANRITEVRGNPQQGVDVFATNVQYHPSGHVRQYTYGNGLTENVGFDG